MSITPDRLQRAIAEGQSFETFAAGAGERVDEYRGNYAAAALDDHDRQLVAEFDGPLDVVALVEHGCADVMANLPIVARVADDTGALRLHVLSRDANPDLAEAYAENGHSRIPTYIVIGPDGQARGALVERTQVMHDAVAAYLAGFFAAHPDIDRATFPYGLTDELKAELMGGGIANRHAKREVERQSMVQAIHDIALDVPARTDA